MTVIQICALIVLITLAGLLVWAGYFMGHSDGRSASVKENDDIQSAESAKTIRELRASLDFIKADHARLGKFSKRLQQALTLGEPECQTLLDIAERLRIAAETFAAFRTGEKTRARNPRPARSSARHRIPLGADKSGERRMSQICPQSNTHRNPAHAPPAADEPTRNRTSEESGMKKDQHNTHSTTALLRKETSVDTLETNSLCCAAAGIIAPFSSSAEALTPHEKLRKAAALDATLYAQDRPLAQPVMGYTQFDSAKDRTKSKTNVSQEAA